MARTGEDRDLLVRQGLRHRVDQKRVLTAHDYLVSVREAHTLIKVPIDTLKKWIRRGKLAERGSH